MWYVAESKIHGKGAFASAKLSTNRRVGVVALPKAIDKWYLTEFGSMINHQKNGNCELRREKDNSYWLYTIKEVEQGVELVSDYTKSPQPFSSFIGGYTEL